MKTIKGDLLKLALEGEFDVIIHGCNIFGIMGAGIALQIKKQFPEAYGADLETKKGDIGKLGTYSSTIINRNNKYFTIVNAYTQGEISHNGETVVDYKAIRNCFKCIKRDFSGLKIGYCKIGSGLAGGDWKVISAIIDEELQGEDHTLVEYKQ
jgi:O-acetyl-ADP-ribose deacetylase (regulator of RNase III)